MLVRMSDGHLLFFIAVSSVVRNDDEENHPALFMSKILPLNVLSGKNRKLVRSYFAFGEPE